VGQREDTDCNQEEVDVSLGVDVGTVVGDSAHGEGVNLGVGLGVVLVVGPPPLHFPRREAPHSPQHHYTVYAESRHLKFVFIWIRLKTCIMDIYMSRYVLSNI